ncbi:radical SAM/SPASM domain protein, ACGX system [Clostridium sp.]|uniref:radical SAM/SPASM domain protein, ACGX system n=1 Tax=Clostridium sp. TaxID=1506 RepID=UPI002848F158|nr:radical SAM/SPASM domain protein, ACGX system [Clostridium sp.]MDR3597103.1 radical SAM/SPASM domain protein, ACGX system [Clostridium sp.]
MEQYLAFQWHITDTCDQRCQHCYIFSENNDIPIIEMAYENIEAVLKNCTDMCEKLNRIPYFYITGGDPILHKDFWKMLEMFKANNITFGILGNPFHLNDEVCRKLRYYGCDKYQLSIDGLRETHDSIRKPGSFDTTIEKIKCIRNAGIKCAIMTTVSKTNISEIPEIIDIVAHHNVDIFAFARYCPTSLEKSTMHIEPNEYKEFLEVVWKKFDDYKDSDTTFNLKDHLWTLFLYEKGLYTILEGLDENTIYDGCNCANCHMTILPNGNVYACRRMESLVGNAFRESMKDIFLGEKMDEFREYDKFEKCSKCELLRFCRGCPAVAYGYTHNSYAADPQCWKEI